MTNDTKDRSRESYDMIKKHLEKATADNDAEYVRNLPNTVKKLEITIAELDEKTRDLQGNTISDLIASVRSLSAQKKRNNNIEKLYYFLPLAVAFLFVRWLVVHDWAAHPTVAITFDVGEIIGGLLVGVGALAAGIAYAVSVNNKQ